MLVIPVLITRDGVSQTKGMFPLLPSSPVTRVITVDAGEHETAEGRTPTKIKRNNFSIVSFSYSTWRGKHEHPGGKMRR
jgi:hypothetical protein